MIRRAFGLDKQNGRIDLFALAGLVLIGCVLAIGLPVPVAALLIAAAAGLAVLSPSAALGATLAATPLIFRPIEVGSSSWSLLELALVAGAIGLAGRIGLEILSTRSFEPIRAVLPATSIIIGAVALILLAAFALTNLADAEHRDASVRAVRTIIVEPLVVLPLSMYVLRRGRIDIALGALASAMVISAGWGALGLATGLGVEADGIRRAVGPYTHPNNLAFFLERATLLTALPAMLIPRYRRIGLVLFGIGIAGLLTTFSRGALLGFPAGLVVALWLAGRLRAIAGVVAGLLAAAGAFALLAGDRLFDSGSDGSEPSRLVIWDGAERILRDFPLTGIGPDQFYVMYGLRYIEPVGWPERYTSHPHNLFLDFWLSLGIGGLAFAIVAVIWIGVRILKLRTPVITTDVQHLRPLALAGAATLTAGVVHGLVDNAFFLPDLAVLTWFAATLLVWRPIEAQR